MYKNIRFKKSKGTKIIFLKIIINYLLYIYIYIAIYIFSQ